MALAETVHNRLIRTAAVRCVETRRKKPEVFSGVTRHGYQADRQKKAYSRHSGATMARARCQGRPPGKAIRYRRMAPSGIQAARYRISRRSWPMMGCIDQFLMTIPPNTAAPLTIRVFLGCEGSAR